MKKRKNEHDVKRVLALAKQMDQEVAEKGKAFEKLLAGFNILSPYDEMILISILTNLLAYVQAHAECYSSEVEKEVKEIHKIHLKYYREKIIKATK